MKLIVAGSRDVTNYNVVKYWLDDYRKRIEVKTIISGAARGADTMGERYANENNLELEVYPADWKNLGKAAGYRRNEVMARKGDLLIAFWDGKSRGTKHMIDIAQREGLPVTIITDPKLFKEIVQIDEYHINKYMNYDKEINEIEADDLINEYFWDVKGI